MQEEYAMQMGHRRSPYGTDCDSGRQYYHLACAHVLSESLEAGFDQLAECLIQTQITWAEVENDPCWDDGRGHQRYQELQDKYGVTAI